MKPKTSKKQNEDIKLAVFEFNELQREFKKYEEEYKKKKEQLQVKIKNYMFINGFNSFKFGNSDGTFFKVANVKRKKIDFDIPKLKTRLSKDILKQILIKEYRINDFDGLKKYLKSCGVDPKEFIKYLDINEVVNQKMVNQLSDLGEITSRDLKGCYTVTEEFAYVRVTESENKEAEE